MRLYIEAFEKYTNRAITLTQKTACPDASIFLFQPPSSQFPQNTDHASEWEKKVELNMLCVRRVTGWSRDCDNEILAAN